MVMLAAPIAAKVGQAALSAVARKVSAKKKVTKKAGVSTYRRRRTRLLTLSQREELTWISRHLGRTAAAERMAHYRR